MADLFVLVNAAISWEEFVGRLRQIIIVEGDEAPNELGNHCTWRILGAEIVAYDDPQFEYDESLPECDLSVYNFVVRIIMYRYHELDEVSRFQMAMGRFMFIRLRDEFGAGGVLIEDLQKLVKIE